MFDEILDNLSQLDLVKNDPKTACLIHNIQTELARKPSKGEPKRKIIIFSEYLDTVKYLEKELRKHYNERMLVVAGDLSATKITQIVKNFDASSKTQEDDFDILLSSDRISEGFNLNRAGMVINYDIPWNPVRVIQRVGRINRISKKVFDELFIINFFPTEKGAELVKSREIAQNKMFLIHSALGEDAKIFDIDEEPTPAGLYSRVQQNPDEQEEESFYTKALNKFSEIKKQHPDLIKNLKNYPPRIKVAKRFIDNELLVFYKKGRLYVSAMLYDDANKAEPYQTAFEDVFDKIICEPDEKSLPLSDGFWLAYEAVKNLKDSLRSSGGREKSLEQKALGKLDSLIRTNQDAELMPHKDFLRTLREDVIDYGTLSDYTLRRIVNIEIEEKRFALGLKEIQSLKQELGEDYLLKEKVRQKNLNKEIIIAIENQKL
ncbi:helicase domain-containing protein [Candidatus Magnetoovum chiemensis]|nr:helicase domain-containing protein [Candidatus Magnetoovum chiemensis]